jgi:hypothetical protein
VPLALVFGQDFERGGRLVMSAASAAASINAALHRFIANRQEHP